MSFSLGMHRTRVSPRKEFLFASSLCPLSDSSFHRSAMTLRSAMCPIGGGNHRRFGQLLITTNRSPRLTAVRTPSPDGAASDHAIHAAVRRHDAFVTHSTGKRRRDGRASRNPGCLRDFNAIHVQTSKARASVRGFGVGKTRCCIRLRYWPERSQWRTPGFPLLCAGCIGAGDPGVRECGAD